MSRIAENQLQAGYRTRNTIPLASRKVLANGMVVQNPYIHSIDQLHELGDVLELDERLWVYGSAGASLTRGLMNQSSAPVTLHLGCATPAIVAIGQRVVTITLGATAAVADQYAEGTMLVETLTGLGFSYRIKTHPAADASASLALTLYDPLVVALGADSTITLVAHPAKAAIVVPSAGVTAPALGVNLCAITNAYFGWFQRQGPAALLCKTGVVIGDGVTIGGTTPGACGPVTAATYTQVWGHAMRAAAADAFCLIDLDLPV